MFYKVLLHPNAAKALQKLDDPNKDRLKKAFRELEADPCKAGKQLHPSDFWSLRSGDYRAIYEINSEKNQVIILFVGHRKKVYDDFSKLF